LNFDLIAVPTTDTLINNPDFRSEERLFLKIEKLLDFQPEKLIIQTLDAENQAIRLASQSQYKDFFEQELKIRKALTYPPFSRIARLSFRHKERKKADYASRVTFEKLSMAAKSLGIESKVQIMEPTFAFAARERNLYTQIIIIKFHPSLDISQLLQYADSKWHTEINPLNLT
jgi:primosomal protein N' (replication factor Y) (superfamily II helicase)